MLFLRSFLGKIKRWPNLCWVSKKEKKGGEGKRKRKQTSQTLPNVRWGQKSPLVENHWCGVKI